MTQRRLEAIGFDLWDTLVVDDSDEVKRQRQGLLSKREQRRQWLWEALDRTRSIPREVVTRAYDVADAAFTNAWRDQQVTWTIRERLDVVLEELGRKLPDAILD